MASPPFNIAETTPGDSDIVSQFPAAERTFRDVVEDWISVEHDTSGYHGKVTLDQISSPTGVADYTTVWADSVGDLRYRKGTGTVAWIMPPGSVMDYAGTSAPEGWLLCYGQAISRSTYSALFTAIGTTYGTGDGSTTFNLPDLRGRVVAGKDDMGGSSANRLTNQSGGLNGDTLGATGGAETHTLTEAQLAVHDHADNFTLPNHAHSDSFAISGSQSGGLGRALDTTTIKSGSDTNRTAVDTWTDTTLSISGSVGSVTSNPAITGAVSNAGGGEAHNNVQPTIILNKIIKT